jgi:hypothetical protein
MQRIISDPRFSEKVLWVNYLGMSVLFTLNVIGSPAIKYVYLIYAAFIFFSVLFLTPILALPLIIAYGFFEGQGRVVWNYHPAARIAFDVLIVLATLRSFIAKKDIKVVRYIPKPMLLLILLHFLWYLVETFNLNAVNTFAAVAGTKVYIFPFFLLLFFRQNEDYFTMERFQKLGNMLLFILLVESALALYQLSHLEGLMLQISDYYRVPMHGTTFTMNAFRPFGTTYLPGAISVYIFLSFSILFIRKKFSAVFLSVLIPTLSLFFVVFIACQVRSALLKYVFITIGSFGSIIIIAKNRLGLFVRMAAISAFLLPVGIYFIYPKLEARFADLISLEAGLQRWQEINSLDDVTSHRVGFGKSIEIALDRLDQFPFGLGPATTGAAAGFSREQITSDPVFSKETFWGHDNFFLSMIIEFGYGCIFYLGYILAVPVFLFYFLLRLYRERYLDETRIVFIALLNTGIIILGNWGAIGINYNPESFYFWLWTALGFNTYYMRNKTTSSEIQTGMGR